MFVSCLFDRLLFPVTPIAPFHHHRPHANRERAKAEGTLADALVKVAELEDQLDKAGGDAAAGRQAMRALEAANKEGLEEVSKRWRGVSGV